MITRSNQPPAGASAQTADPVNPSRRIAPGNTAESWMQNIPCDTAEAVSADELTSLSALIAYAADKTGSSEFRIERDLADRFHIPNVKCLPSSHFDAAIRYLVDQVPAAIA